MQIVFPDGRYTMHGKPVPVEPPKGPFNRVAFAAAHVVSDPLSNNDPSGAPAIDWERTLAFRAHLLDLGFGIAEAMDTSQRGMGLDWPSALELIRRSLAHAGNKAGMIYSGCGTDHLPPQEARSLDDVIAAYLQQLHAVQNSVGASS